MSQHTAMVLMPHPIIAAAGREVITDPFQGGETIAEYLARHGIAPDYPCILTLDGVSVPPSRWDVVCPRHGQLIEVRAVPQGGGGSDMRRAILSIVVMVAAYYTGGYASMYFGSQLAGSAATGLTMYAGMSLVNKIAPIPQPNLSAAQGLGTTSPTYAISGGSNRARLGEPLPLLFGTHRMWPDMAAKGFTQFVDDEQYFNMALNFGLGDLVVDTTSYKIGDTPITEFEGVEIYLSGSDGVIPNFPGNVDTISGDDLTFTAGWITRTGSTDTTALEVDLAGTLFYAGDNGVTSRTVTFAMEFRRLDGPAGDPLGTWQAYIGDIAYTHYWSLGYWYYGVWKQKRYSAEPYENYTDGAYTGYTWYDKDPTSNRPNATDPYPEVYRWRAYADAGDDPTPPAERTQRQMDITNADRRPVRRTYRIERLPPGQYEVRVQRVSADETDERAVSDFTWSALRSFQVDNGSYMGQTRLGLRIKASSQVNGQIDRFNAMVSRRVWVWSGTDWVLQFSSNPAWVFLDFATGVYNGDGQRLYGAGYEYADIDLDGIKAWAVFCNTNALTFNGIFDRAMTAADTLDAIAACGRATRSMGTGKLGVVWEEQNAPAVAVFGMGNIKAGTFAVDYISTPLADAVEVGFINSANGYQPDTVTCKAPGVTTPTNIKKIDFFGCTSEEMAGRCGNLFIARNVYWVRRITWETDAEGLAVQKGEVAVLSHDLTQWGYSGRLVSGTTTALTLSKPVPFTAGQDHYITIRQPDGTMSTHLVDYQAGQSDQITCSTDPLPASPDSDRPVDWLWLFAPQATPGKRVKIVDIKPVDENTVRLTATDDEPGYYAAETDPYTYIPPSTKTYLTPQISNITITEDLLDLSGLSRVHIVFDCIGAVEWINVRVKYNNGEWRSLGTITERSLSLDLRQGTLLTVWAKPGARVTTNTPTNAQQSYTVQGVDGAMVDITGFSVSASGGFALATWDQHPHTAVRNGGHIRIRHTSKLTGATWSDGTDIGPAIPGNATSAILPLLTGTYMARAIDALGTLSPNAALAVTTVPSVMAFNAVEVIDEAATGWPGTKTNVADPDGELRLAGSATIDSMTTNIDTWGFIDSLGGIVSIGEYLFATDIDLGGVYSSRVTANIEGHAFDANDSISARGYVSTWPSVTGANVDDAIAKLFLRTTEDDPAVSPVWSDWKPFSIGDYLARAMQFKLVLTSAVSNHNIDVSACSVTVDMPDRVEGERGVTVPAGGLALSYANPFRVAPSLGITILDMQAGDTISITNETESGATVRILNGGSGVSRTINWLAKGYGQKVI